MIPVARLTAAPTNATPTNSAQKKCHGIHAVTNPAIKFAYIKCCTPNTASEIANKYLPALTRTRRKPPDRPAAPANTSAAPPIATSSNITVQSFGLRGCLISQGAVTINARNNIPAPSRTAASRTCQPTMMQTAAALNPIPTSHAASKFPRVHGGPITGQRRPLAKTRHSTPNNPIAKPNKTRPILVKLSIRVTPSAMQSLPQRILHPRPENLRYKRKVYGAG